MSKSANVKSIDAVKQFAAAVIQFREEAKNCMTRIDMEIGKVIGWLERDRPGFWKREAEHCDRRHAEARVSLHRCRMRRVGDFRPTCFEEQKMLQHCKRQLEYSRAQLGVIRQWTITSKQEAEEYYGRASQLMQTLERDLPQLIMLLKQSAERLESYHKVQLPSWSPAKLNFGDPTAYGASAESSSEDESATEEVENDESDTSAGQSVTDQAQNKGD